MTPTPSRPEHPDSQEAPGTQNTPTGLGHLGIQDAPARLAAPISAAAPPTPAGLRTPHHTTSTPPPPANPNGTRA